MKAEVQGAPLSSSSRRVPYTAREVMERGEGTSRGRRKREEEVTLDGRGVGEDDIRGKGNEAVGAGDAEWAGEEKGIVRWW